MADTKMKVADKVANAQKERIALMAQKLRQIAAQQTRTPISDLIMQPLDTYVASRAVRN